MTDNYALAEPADAGPVVPVLVLDDHGAAREAAPSMYRAARGGDF